MCDHPFGHNPCPNTAVLSKNVRPFPMLLLSCWQREYDVRPFKKFKFSRLEFEQRMDRKYHCLKDFRTIVDFLLQRPLIYVSISSVPVSSRDPKLLKSFVRSLSPLSSIELTLMRLPFEFYVMLRLNVHKMKLKDFSLKGTALTNRAVGMLREFLVASQTLQSLNVSNCSLNQNNFAMLADGVYKSSSIRKLCANRILGLNLLLDTEKIASVVGSLLMQNKLIELEMSQCEFVAQDMEIIAEYLQSKNCSLRRLILTYNKIATDGAMFLMRAIAQSGVQELLDITGNSIGTHGGEWIAKYFSSCLMLQHLYIGYNDIGASAINEILLTLKKPCRIKRLQIYGNHFDSTTAEILRRLMDADVLLHENIDISWTYGQKHNEYRVVPWR